MPLRARGLPPPDRRDALVKSTIALLREHRRVPSTREIAKAAGVAEGTIFKAFPRKEDLLAAAGEAAFCPVPFLRQFDTIDRALPLDERLVLAVGFLQQRFMAAFEVMEALGLQAPPPSRLNDHRLCSVEQGHRPSSGPSAKSRGRPEWEKSPLTALIEPDAAQLRCTPAELVDHVRLLTFSGSHPKLVQGRPLAPEAIVDVLLNGLLKPRRRKAT